MYLMHIKRGDELLFSFHPRVGKLRRVCSFLDPLPCSSVRRRDSIYSFVYFNRVVSTPPLSPAPCFTVVPPRVKETRRTLQTICRAKGNVGGKILPRRGDTARKRRKGVRVQSGEERGGAGRGSKGRQTDAEPTRNTNYNALRTMALNLLDALFRSLNSIKSGNEVCRRVSRPPTLVSA